MKDLTKFNNALKRFKSFKDEIGINGYCLWQSLEHDNFMLEAWPTKEGIIIVQLYSGGGFQTYKNY